MDKNRRVLGIFLVVSLLVCEALGPDAAATSEAPTPEWKRQFGDAKFWYTFQAMALSQDGDILVAGTSTLAGWSGESPGFWLWRVNQRGEKVQEIQIKDPHGGRTLSAVYPYIRSLAALPEGDVVLVVEFIKDQPAIVKIDRNGKVAFVKDIAKPGSRAVISKMVVTVDKKHLILIGTNWADGLLMKMDVAGNILWEKTMDHGKTELLVDVLADRDGSFVLIGNSGTYGVFFTGPSEIWVTKVDAKGDITSEKTFPGRYGSVARAQDGGYGIVYDKSRTGRRDIWVQTLTANLEESWNAQVLTSEAPGATFKIAAVPSGGFVVVGGTQDHKLWVSRINAAGKTMWTFTGDQSLSQDLVSLGEQLFILLSVPSGDEKRRFSFKVGIMKFPVKW